MLKNKGFINRHGLYFGGIIYRLKVSKKVKNMDSFNVSVQRDAQPSSASKFASLVMSALVVLLPVFFIPSLAVSVPVAKIILLTVGVLAALAAVILSTIQNGEIKIPWNLMTASVVALPLAFLISALFSSNPANSLWGYGFENSTFGFVLLASLGALLSARIFTDKNRLSTTLWGVIIASLVLGVFHVLRFFVGAGKLSLKVFADNFSNALGGWNELALWFGLAGLLTMVFLELSPSTGSGQVKGLKKIIAYATLALSLVVMIVINFSTAWYLVGVFALVFLVYELSRQNVAPDGSVKRRVAWHALIIMAIALICILGNTAISTNISQKLNLGTVEVRPSWTATWDVLRSSLADRPLIGSGANNFTSSWLIHKPAGINDTIFWNTDFSSGIGLIPTFAITTGVLGIIAWLFFLGMTILSSVKLLFREGVESEDKVLTVASVFGALFLWAATVFYVPSSAIFASAFLFTGFVMASLYRSGLLKTRAFSLFSVPRASFISVLVLIAVLIGVVSLGFLFVERAIAQIYFGKALVSANQSQSIDMAENYLNRAVALYPFDTFYRSLATVSMTKLSTLLQDQNASPEAVRAGFQTLLSNAIQNAQLATQKDGNNYQNWLALAQIYGSVVPKPFQIQDAYESARGAYTKAKELNPYSPSILLAMARLESDNESLDKAGVLAEEAAKMKTNYADAHFFLSQIAVQQGNISRAIEKTETTIILSPSNAGLYFQLGVLYFNVPNYGNASQALGKAVEMVPDYANARYFLGLSLARIGDKAGATQQFEAILKTNPNNKEIMKVLENLKAGKDPLSGIAGAPQTRNTLPVSEQ